MSGRAYIVSYTDGWEPRAEIVFSERAVEARRVGANMLDVEFGDVSCRRAPYCDDFEGDARGLTLACLANGWSFDLEDGTSNDVDDPFVDRRGGVWRSPWHWLADREEAIARRHEWQRGVRRAAKAILGSFPEAFDIRTHVNVDGTAQAYFRLPYIPGDVVWREEGGAVMVRRCDLPTFRRVYRVNRDAEVQECAA